MQTISDKDSFKAELKKAGLKITPLRIEIFDILMHSQAPLTIQQVIEQSGSGHYVSVYRSIDALLKADLLKKVPQGFKNLVELSDTLKPHHHHAICELCGSTVEIHDEDIELELIRLTRKANLEPTKHHFELYGICMGCRSEKLDQAC